MKVILLQNVPKIGQKGDIKDLKEGYARNMLIPKGLAKVATPGDLKNIEQKAKMGEAAHEAKVKKVAEIFSKLKDQKVEIQEKNDNGHLFAKVGKKEVIGAVEKTHGVKLEESWFDLDAIKQVGEYVISLKFEKLHADITLEVKG